MVLVLVSLYIRFSESIEAVASEELEKYQPNFDFMLVKGSYMIIFWLFQDVSKSLLCFWHELSNRRHNSWAATTVTGALSSG